MGVFDFLKRSEKRPVYSKAVRRVGVWKKMWKGHNAGQHLVIEKEKEMSSLKEQLFATIDAG